MLPPPKQRIAARLLLASCTLALGLGLGTAVAVAGVLRLQHAQISLRAPDQRGGSLDGGVHQLFLPLRATAEPSFEEAHPACTVTPVAGGAPAPPVSSSAGFAAVRLPGPGRYRVACTADRPVDIVLQHEAEPFTAYLAAVGRGLVPAIALTALAAVLAARALVAARRLRSVQQ
ncbi:MAG: hypothetical protein ABIS47_10030 [Acidimicrobiales bacterium]